MTPKKRKRNSPTKKEAESDSFRFYDHEKYSNGVVCIWKYFYTSDYNWAKCKMCNVVIRTQDSNTKGLWTHIESKKHHPLGNVYSF